MSTRQIVSDLSTSARLNVNQVVLMDLDAFIDGIYHEAPATFAFDHVEVPFLLSLIFEGQSAEDILQSYIDDQASDAETHGFGDDEIQKHSNQVIGSVKYVIQRFWERYGKALPLDPNGANHCGGFNRNGKIVVIERTT